MYYTNIGDISNTTVNNNSIYISTRNKQLTIAQNGNDSNSVVRVLELSHLTAGVAKNGNGCFRSQVDSSIVNQAKKVQKYSSDYLFTFKKALVPLVAGIYRLLGELVQDFRRVGGCPPSDSSIYSQGSSHTDLTKKVDLSLCKV